MNFKNSITKHSLTMYLLAISTLFLTTISNAQTNQEMLDKLKDLTVSPKELTMHYARTKKTALIILKRIKHYKYPLKSYPYIRDLISLNRTMTYKLEYLISTREDIYNNLSINTNSQVFLREVNMINNLFITKASKYKYLYRSTNRKLEIYLQVQSTLRFHNLKLGDAGWLKDFLNNFVKSYAELQTSTPKLN